MLKNKVQILSTVNLPLSLVNKAGDSDIVIDALDFIEIKGISDKGSKEKIKNFSEQHLTVVFTSGHAALMVIASLENKKPNWDIYCISGNTKKIISDYFGKTSIVAVADNASSLADIIKQDNKKKITFFCGNLRRDELPDKLSRSGITVNELVVYETVLTPHMISKNYDGILFFSPSAVNSFFSVNHPNEKMAFFAIGDTTADEIRRHASNKIIVGQSPLKDMLVKTAIEYFQTTIHQ